MEDKSIGKYISILARQSQAYISREMQKLGITGSEYIFLINTPNEGVVTQQEICNNFELDPAFATRGVKSLVGKGYLTRTKSKTDKRSYEIAITEKGKKLKPFIQERLDHWTEVLAGDMKNDDITEVINTLIELKNRANKEIQIQKEE
jgi:DNA-binding MarR family transcriptional regulator